MQNFGDQTTRKSYLPDLNDYPDSDLEDEKDQGPDEEIQGWDVFKHFPTRIKTGSKANTKFFDRAAQVTKFVSYFVLFAVMLVCGIVAKATIILAVSQIDDKGPVDYCDYNDIAKEPTHRKVSATVSPQYHIGWYWCVIGAFAFPEILGIVKATHHWLFKKRNVPRKVDLAVLFTIDTLHAVGLALLFLLVLPELNSIQAVVVSSCTCFVPGLLAIFSRNLRQHSQGKAIALLIGDIVAFAFQLCGAFIWLYSDSRVSLTIQARSILPVALVLTSCRWWGNYVSAYSSFGFIRFLFRVKKRLEISKGLAHGFSAVWRIVVFLATSVLIAYSKGIEPGSFFDSNILIGKYNVSLYDGLRIGSTSKMASRIIDDVSASGNLGYFTVDSYRLSLVVLVIHLSSAFLTYSSGIFAYKTMMQNYGFALPVTLTVPATVGVIILASALRHTDTCFFHHLIPDYVFFAVPENFGSLLDFFCQWYPWIWLVTLLSQVWITMHIWLPHSERLAATENIFLTPTYDSLIMAQSIVLNRQVDEIPGDCHVPETLGIAEESGTNAIYSNCSSKSGLSELELSDRVTRIIVCATMWHETEDEMTEFVGSILRLDMDQASKRFTQGWYNIRMQDYYELETHVFFDDAFRCMHACEGRCEHNENETQVNDYVMTLVNTMQKSVERLNIFARPPTKYPTPYGGRLEWNLPGQTRMIVHLKDKNKIRHRKRWSQVMYMYYLLGHLLMDTAISQDRKEVIAENTYLLTLDGDIDFRPSAVKILVDLMKRNKDLGAACGRIHPIGTGPMVWFQKFEYAIGHWLQKSTEHTIGSVLCSPGAFSLFRAKALMEHNVMRKYATQSTEPMHYVQYDQGEDRWLCTLILQVGYRVEYSAASDSYTHAPETFNEFYNQRRRWIPSTIANIFDLLGTSQETRRVNNDISWLYIVYQWVLMGSTVLGPGTIFLMLVGAFVAAFRIGNWISLGYNLIPIIIFIAVCVACNARIQLMVASVISAFYGLVMIIVLVGIMLQIAEDGWVAPSTILFFVVAGQLIIAALLHPQEWDCLCCGIIYYVTVPSMYMLLIIFALFNVNNVTWGTRDSKAPGAQGSGKTENHARNEKATIGDRFRNASGKSRGAIEFSLAGLFKCMLCTQDDNSSEDGNRKIDAISESLDRISTRLETIERNSGRNDAPLNCRSDVFVSNRSSEAPHPIIGRKATTDSELYTDDYTDRQEDTASESDVYDDGSTFESSNFLISPYWLQDERLRKGGVEFLSREEEYFWESLIEKYLHPIEEDKKKLAKIAEGLKDLRNEYVFKFFMLNALFVLIIFLMQLNKDVLHLEWPLGETYNITYVSDRQEVLIAKNYLKLEPIGCVFILGFVLILGVQFIAMLFHRFNTFSHILANTSIEWPWCKKPTDPNNEADLEKHAEDIVDGLHKVIENNAGSSVARRNSTIAPGKRKTVRDLIDSQDRRVRLPTSLDNLFRRNLNDSRSEISRFMSTRLPPGVVEAFERRHSSMVASQRPTQPCNNVNGYRGVNNVAGTKLGQNSIAREDSYNYDNKAFVPDSYDENPTDSEATLSHRPSQISFHSDDQ